MGTRAIEAVDLDAGYGGTRIVRGVSLQVDAGEIVALLGPNGAGKTTTMLALSGALAPLGGEVRQGGRRTGAPLFRRARRGLGFVTEERAVFMDLTVRQNIEVARAEVDRVIEIFPELRPLLGRRAGLLSGGEQQMLALARVLARDPSAILADELSLGLAPRAVTRLLQAVRAAADRGAGVLLVEQHVHRVLEVADRVYVISGGRIHYTAPAAQARARLDEIRAHYLSHGAERPDPSMEEQE